MEKCPVCCVCHEECGQDEAKSVEIKNKQYDICKECITSIKGLS